MTPTVHLIDDDVSFLRSMGRRLRSQGFAVATYDSVAEFLLRPDADGPGCVLTDLQMPNRDGFELQKLLAQSPNPLPVIFVTGKGDIPTSVRAMRAGAEDFLTKRADSDELLAAIRRGFQRDRREREARQRRQSARDAIMGLGAREMQVLLGVVQGMQNREMATAYGLSERTINYYRTLLTRGLDIYTSVGLSRFVQEAGMTIEELEAAVAAAEL